MLDSFIRTLESKGVIVDNLRMEKSYMLPLHPPDQSLRMIK